MRGCGLCDSSRRRVLYAGAESNDVSPEDFMITRSGARKPEISQCLDCGVVYNSSPAFSRSVYTEVVDEKYDAESGSRMLEFSRAYKTFKKHFPQHGISKIRLLDAGCFTGVFLNYLKCEEGRTVEGRGIEPSRWAAAEARSKGLWVEEGFIEDLLRPGLSLDAVTMFDVIEHVADPRLLLRHVREALGPEGLLMLTTPNFETVFRPIFRHRYWFFETMHLFYFSPETIRRLLEETGFEVLSLKRHLKVIPFHYLMERIAGQFPSFSFLAKIPWPRGLRLPLYIGQMRVIARKRAAG